MKNADINDIRLWGVGLNSTRNPSLAPLALPASSLVGRKEKGAVAPPLLRDLEVFRKEGTRLTWRVRHRNMICALCLLDFREDEI